MRKLLIGLLALGSLSAFANVDLNGSDIYRGKSSEVIDVQFRVAPGSTDRCMTRAYNEALFYCEKDGYSKCQYVAQDSKSRRTLKSRLGLTSRFIQKRICKVYVQGSNE